MDNWQPIERDERACAGARVMEAPHEMAECIACGNCVRWDLQDHRLFGWQNCKHKPLPAPPETP